ncbi:hypothetical protein [Finegoldia magna]|uniref:hypothetical protein n=1 Tax=Finegoldia magna TaxID=1260 RepID=UPI001C25F698|nr:hypothetical protein [Finegoldia magna]
MAYGWISIHRKIQDDWLWEEKPFSKGQAWIDLLLMVNHDDNTIIFDGKPMQISRGRCITSMQNCAIGGGGRIQKLKIF